MKNRRWARNPIDAFVAGEQSARHLKPRTDASKEVLLRRVYLDLIGLARLPNIDLAYVDAQARDWGVEAVITRVRALAVLCSETDPVSSGAKDRAWERRSLAAIAKRRGM